MKSKVCKKISTSPQGALFLLRISLGGFFLFWALDKIFNPGHAMIVFKEFYKIAILPDESCILGGLQVILSIMFLLGLYKTWTYGAVFLLHLVSVGSSWEKLMAPFENHLFVAGVPLLFAYLALFLAREHDTLFVLRRDRTKYFSDDGRAKVE